MRIRKTAAERFLMEKYARLCYLNKGRTNYEGYGVEVWNEFCSDYREIRRKTQRTLERIARYDPASKIAREIKRGLECLAQNTPEPKPQPS